MDPDQSLYSIVTTEPPRYIPYIVGCATFCIVVTLAGLGTILTYLHGDIVQIATSLDNLETNLCIALSAVNPDIVCNL